MLIIEPHIHMASRTTDDYQAMYRAGIRACVEPSFWLGSERRHAGTFFDYFRLILDFETVRARRFGIDHYAAIAVNPKEAENETLVREVMAGIPEYLDHPRCVALGETGLNNVTDNEKSAMQRQLLVAEERKMPAIIHLPHGPKLKGAQAIVDMIRAEGLTEKRILIDHNNEETMPVSRRTGCWCGLTVYPYSKLSPERVSEIVKNYGPEHLIVNGSADWGVSDPLSLAKVAEHLSKDGHPEETIRKLVFENAMAFYGNSPNWKPRLDLKPVPVSEYQR